MIPYESGYWGVLFALRVRGSVIPRALAWAVPSAALAGVMHWAAARWWSDFDFEALKDSTDSFIFVLSFLLAFRTNLAYGRLWEGMSHLQRMRGAWINAVSASLAFTSEDPELEEDVECFKHELSRLVSMMYCAALQSVASMEDNTMLILDNAGFEVEPLNFIAERCEERCEIIIQWIRRMIIRNYANGVLVAPAPILSRVYQELDKGIVDLSDARRIRIVPFPFPFAQILTIILIIYTCITVVGAAAYDSIITAILCPFLSVATMWSVNYISMEIEMPYGDDHNDLPLCELQDDMNNALISCMQPDSLNPPTFTFDSRRDCVDLRWINRGYHLFQPWRSDQVTYYADLASNVRHSAPMSLNEFESGRKSQAVPRLSKDSLGQLGAMTATARTTFHSDCGGETPEASETLSQHMAERDSGGRKTTTHLMRTNSMLTEDEDDNMTQMESMASMFFNKQLSVKRAISTPTARTKNVSAAPAAPAFGLLGGVPSAELLDLGSQIAGQLRRLNEELSSLSSPQQSSERVEPLSNALASLGRSLQPSGPSIPSRLSQPVSKSTSAEHFTLRLPADGPSSDAGSAILESSGQRASSSRQQASSRLPPLSENLTRVPSSVPFRTKPEAASRQVQQAECVQPAPSDVPRSSRKSVSFEGHAPIGLALRAVDISTE
eukprot:TRINITY_DN91174_c0_g1_i1.p1 TRINITY_DN91174_c0_g1~~TRINITY_DN91174_c0_g1_i1.p1  ORF type:complete len:704 (-),score=105.56 TRINITY_DN91174_c0_g1_i1:306-2306(-)